VSDKLRGLMGRWDNLWSEWNPRMLSDGRGFAIYILSDKIDRAELEDAYDWEKDKDLAALERYMKYYGVTFFHTRCLCDVLYKGKITSAGVRELERCIEQESIGRILVTNPDCFQFKSELTEVEQFIDLLESKSIRLLNSAPFYKKPAHRPHGSVDQFRRKRRWNKKPKKQIESGL